MKISKKAEYALKAIVYIAHKEMNKPIQISDISKEESIPIKFLEQILLTLKNDGILVSKRGAYGGYLIAKPLNYISVGMIIKSMDGPLDPIGLHSDNYLGSGLEQCFGEMVELINEHLNNYTIEDILKIQHSINHFAFEI